MLRDLPRIIAEDLKNRLNPACDQFASRFCGGFL
jgi:hypothetical protein